MAEELREIRSRIDLVDLVGQKVSLRRAGKHWKGLCPFHDDRNPSFYVSRELGRYTCWSCGEKGDAFTWVMKTQNLDFSEALRQLAKLAGVELRRRGRPKESQEQDRSAMDAALEFFRREFGRSSTARAYTEGRGLDEATIEGWEIGYAPDHGDALAATLQRAGQPLAECKKLFLVDQDSSGGYFDRFRGRLMFPIRDERGELVAFGGRLLGDGQPKYINSGDTPLFRKSRVLYGLDRAKDALAKSRQAVLVEGYLDVIACHRAGLTAALASLGTSLTEDHAKLLRRWCERVIVLYDSDAAGLKATRRAIDVLAPEGLVVRVARLPAGDDPDTLLRRSGPAELCRAVDEAVPPLDFEIDELLRTTNPEDPLFWPEAARVLAGAPSNLDIERHLVKLAALFPGPKDPIEAQRALRRDVGEARRRLRPPSSAGRQPPQPTIGAVSRLASAELSGAEAIVFAALLDEDLREPAWQALHLPELFQTRVAETVAAAILAAFPSTPPDGSPALWLPDLESESVRMVLTDLTFESRIGILSSELVHDSIERLEGDTERRSLRQLRTEEMGEEALVEYAARLRQLKSKPIHQ
ncbi:MAG: DNA primase [Fimbriimonas ginsengisoli]|uniref:DNA primase n=1 Tax=Fimbriimonas ginsengisoli TaxID=1005039 RepID=A0A931LWJ0_FIMGI|nr:DNA primase [Fimbriimonas ginsengisoli]